MSNIKIQPVSKPRMTRADTWKKRPCVTKYWAYKDELNEKIKHLDIKDKDVLFVRFYIPMPKSWSNKKKLELLDKPHQQKPDIDNLVKGVMDAIFKEDSHIHTIYAKKIWSNEGSITFMADKDFSLY